MPNELMSSEQLCAGGSQKATNLQTHCTTWPPFIHIPLPATCFEHTVYHGILPNQYCQLTEEAVSSWIHTVSSAIPSLAFSSAIKTESSSHANSLPVYYK